MKTETKQTAEMKKHGWKYAANGKVWLSNGNLVTVAEARRRVKWWDKRSKYADKNNDGVEQ